MRTRDDGIVLAQLRALPDTARLRAGLRLVRDGARRFLRSRWWRVVSVVAAALLGGWLGLALGGQVMTPIGPADVRLSVGPSWHGETVLNVAPLGKLGFDTHAAPLRFEASVSEIRLEAAQEMFENPAAIDQIAAGIGDDLRDGVIRLFIQAAVATVLGAALAAMLLYRDWRRACYSGLTALLVFAATGGVGYATFNPNAIAEPRYTGLLAGAPQVVGSAESAINRFSEYRRQLAGLLGNVSRLYEVTSTLPVYENDDSTIRVLHVSDIHLNPAAWNVIRSLTDQFQVNVVVDSGDLTDRGSATEDAFTDEISSLKVPYVWVRGAHDSMGTQRAVESQDNAVALDEDIREVEGIRFYGAGDPRFTPDKARDNPSRQEVTELGDAQASAVSGADPPLDVAVLHDPAQARAFSGEVPLVLSGHGHQRRTELEPTGTRFFEQGSTGGAGLLGMGDDDEPTPYQASVLYFDAETKRLQAWDDITLAGMGLTSAQIERHIEEEPDRDVTPLAPEDRSVPPRSPTAPSGSPTSPGPTPSKGR